MKASGMCGSDLKFYRSPPGAAQAALGLGNSAEPFIAGHEPCGVVAARGPGVSEREAPIGQRVMDHHYSGCGVCKHCRVGWSQLCKAGITVYGVTANGGHAEYLKVPARTLVPLPEELSFIEGAAVSCGTGTAYGALRRMHLAGGSTLAVFGQGPVGLSATLLAAKMGARVIAVETNAERRALAKQFGADQAIDAADPEKMLKDLTRGEGVDLALDCTGIAAARVAAVRSAKTWGTVCFVGEGGEVTLDVSRDLLRKQLTLLGSWTFSAMGQAECARFVVDNRISLDKIFSHRWKLEQAEEAYRVFDTQSTGKGVICF
jgi:threonine dehydrogenase-like Zn-dependent dehydrogenase